jgi:hypothetical protein
VGAENINHLVIKYGGRMHKLRADRQVGRQAGKQVGRSDSVAGAAADFAAHPQNILGSKLETRAK